MMGLFFEDLTVGQSAEMTRTVTVEVIEAFAEVSGDANPLHLDHEFARTTVFGERIAHGMLAAAYVSAVLGMQLPGPGAVYVTQSLRFRRPVKIGDEVTARVTVRELDDRHGRATLRTVCEVGGKVVMDGEAVVMPPRKAA